MMRMFNSATWSPLNQRRLANFKANRRGYYSLWVFMALFIASLFAELIANDKPLVVYFDNEIYLPINNVYPETDFAENSKPRPIIATNMS